MNPLTFLKRAVATLFLILLLTGLAQAVTVTVGAIQPPNYNYGGTTATIKIWASTNFYDSAGILHVGGAVGGFNNFFMTVTCAVAGTTLSIPSFQIPSTQDSIDHPEVTYTAVVYDYQNVRRDTILTAFMVPATPATTTWSQIALFNAAATMWRPDNTVWTALQTQNAINATILQKASDVAYGIVRFPAGEPPVVSSDPVAVPDNDRRLLDASSYSSFANAISTIGSAPATLNISTLTSVPQSVTVPSNVELRFVGAGQLQPATGVTLTIQGPLLASPRQIFSTPTIRHVEDGVVTNNSATITSATANFQSADVNSYLIVGTSGNPKAHAFQIQSVTNSTTAVLNGTIDAASGTGSYFHITSSRVIFTGPVRDFYPEWFGAVGTSGNATDSYAAIQATIDAAHSRGYTSGTNWAVGQGANVNLLGSTYNISKTLQINGDGAPDSINLIGSSGSFTTINWTGATTSYATKFNRNWGFEMRDITINNTVAKGSTVGMVASGPGTGTQTHGATFTNCQWNGFHYGFQAGEFGQAASELTFIGCAFSSNDTGFRGASTGNTLNLNFYDSGGSSNSLYAIDCPNFQNTNIYGGSYSANGLDGGLNDGADFHFDGNAPFSVSGVYSELGAAFIKGPSNGVLTVSSCVVQSRVDTSIPSISGNGQVFITGCYFTNRVIKFTGNSLIGNLTIINTGVLTDQSVAYWVNDGTQPYNIHYKLIGNYNNNSGGGLPDEEGIVINGAKIPYDVSLVRQQGISRQLAGLRGISATQVLANNLHGQATFATAGTKAVTFKRSVTDAATTNGGNTVTSATAAFTFADVGKMVTIQGAGIFAVPIIQIFDNGTTHATANATVNSSGVITGITMTNMGAGITSASVIVYPGVNAGGSGAVLTPVISSGQITSITINNGGQDYGSLFVPIISINSGTSANLGSYAYATLSNASMAIGQNEADANYTIHLSPNAQETISWSAKTASGFTLTSSNAASTAIVDWFLVR